MAAEVGFHFSEPTHMFMTVSGVKPVGFKLPYGVDLLLDVHGNLAPALPFGAVPTALPSRRAL
jgi:hypothetical protein